MSTALTKVQRKAVELLSAGMDAKAAASGCGVSASTVQKWYRLEVVRQAVDERRSELLQDLAGVAISVISDLLGADQPPAIRLKAATEVLDRAGYSRKPETPAAPFSITIDLSSQQRQPQSVIEHDSDD